MVNFQPITSENRQNQKTGGVSFSPLKNQPTKGTTSIVANEAPWEDRAIGLAQSGLGMAVGTSRVLQEVGLKIMGMFGADREDYGMKSLKTETPEGMRVTEALTPKTAEQSQGKLVGDVAQYIAPASKIHKATQALPFLQRIVARVAPDLALSVSQNLGADTGMTTENTAITGITSATANALLPGPNVSAISQFARTTAPGYVADVATGLTGQRGEEKTGASAFIPGVGTALAGTIGAVQVAPKIRQAMQEKATTHVYTKRYDALSGLQQNNKPLNRIITSADKSGIDTKRILAESNLLAGTVDNAGTINTKASVQDFDDMLRPYEGKVGEALATEGKVIPVEVLKQKMLSTIDDSGLVGSMKQTAKNRALSEIEAIALEADNAGNIPLKLVHDLKVQTNKTNAKSFIDPEKNAIGKVVGKGLKEFVEESTDALDVKTYNAELRKLYSVRDVLEGLNGRKVEGGRLGKYFAQTVGAVAGSAVGGPVGAVVGAEVGSIAKGAQMTRAFGGAQGAQIKPSQTMLDALKIHMRGTRQMSQASTNAPITNAIDSTLPQPQTKATDLSTATPAIKIAERLTPDQLALIRRAAETKITRDAMGVAKIKPVHKEVLQMFKRMEMEQPKSVKEFENLLREVVEAGEKTGLTRKLR